MDIRAIIKDAGGQTALAALLNTRQSVVGNWVLRNNVPADRVLDIERVAGVSRHDLRPDIYPKEYCACKFCLAEKKESCP